MAGRIREDPADLADLHALREAIELTEELPFSVTLWTVQNIAYDLLQEVYPSMRDRSAGEDDARAWVEDFDVLARKLSLKMA
jgi:hypothetical protein